MKCVLYFGPLRNLWKAMMQAKRLDFANFEGALPAPAKCGLTAQQEGFMTAYALSPSVRLT